jgi:hypothetical protein
MIFYIATVPAWRLILLSEDKNPLATKYIILPHDEYYSEQPEYIQLPDGRYIQIASWMEDLPEHIECFSFISNPNKEVRKEASKFKVVEEIW